MEITLDNWNGSHCKEEVYHINSSERLLEILEKLDAKQHTLVNLVFIRRKLFNDWWRGRKICCNR